MTRGSGELNVDMLSDVIALFVSLFEHKKVPSGWKFMDPFGIVVVTILDPQGIRKKHLKLLVGLHMKSLCQV